MQYSQGNVSVGIYFYKVADLKDSKKRCFEKRLQHRCFPFFCEYCEICNRFFIEHLRWLLRYRYEILYSKIILTSAILGIQICMLYFFSKSSYFWNFESIKSMYSVVCLKINVSKFFETWDAKVIPLDTRRRLNVRETLSHDVF